MGEITADKTSNLPPMLKQYLEYKERHPDALIFFQVGDFYELFFEDAVEAAKVLNLTLTSRDKNSPNPIPMCGVPVASIENYLERLAVGGYAAAVVSQEEVPADFKGAVPRKLEKIVTPGVRLLLTSKAKEFLPPSICAVVPAAGASFAVAVSDLDSGRIVTTADIDIFSLIDLFKRINPSEVVIPEEHNGFKIDRRTAWVKRLTQVMPELPIRFKPVSWGEAAIARDPQAVRSLVGFVSIGSSEKAAVWLLVNYVDQATVVNYMSFTEISPCSNVDRMMIDALTVRNLDLLPKFNNFRKDLSLFEVLDQTLTRSGRVKLRSLLIAPLVKKQAIDDRLDALDFFYTSTETSLVVREGLRQVADLERIATRLSLAATTPLEIFALRDSLIAASKMKRYLSEQEEKLPLMLKKIIVDFNIDQSLLELLSVRFADEPCLAFGQGAIFKNGFNFELDEICRNASLEENWISEYEKQERQRSGIQSLKVKYNSVIGFFIETTKVNLKKIPSDYIPKQSTANTERFTTSELRERERQLLGAKARLLALEKSLFAETIDVLRESVAQIRRLATAVAELDLISALSEVARQNGWKRPAIYEDQRLKILAGKHPILEKLIGDNIVPNDFYSTSESERFFVLTGPNMGGKSTYLRQIGLISILAQIGSFVPAQSAEIGIVERMFARLGASDNLYEGDSTFMVEMREAANIVRYANQRSLILIDELGRGTTTQDGVSIARAFAEWIALKIKARTIFATHFHELTKLEGLILGVKNLSVGCLDQGDELIFTHKISYGAASKSYGIDVAKKSGLNDEIIDRALELSVIYGQAVGSNSFTNQQLPIFENPQDFKQAPSKSNSVDLGLNSHTPEKITNENTKLARLTAEIEKFQIDSSTPLDAFNFVAQLKREFLSP